jgi:hypothetical protein
MVIVNISKEELNALKEVAGSRQLVGEHIEVLRKVLMEAGVFIKLDEYVAIKNGDSLAIYSSDLFVEVSLSDTDGKVMATVVIENVKNIKYRERIDITFVAGEGR